MHFQPGDVGNKFGPFHHLSVPLKWAYSNYLQTGRWVQVIDNINGAIIFVHAHKDLEEVEDQDKNEGES